MKISWKIGSLALTGVLFYSISFGQLGNIEGMGRKDGGGRNQSGGNRQEQRNSGGRQGGNQSGPNRNDGPGRGSNDSASRNNNNGPSGSGNRTRNDGSVSSNRPVLDAIRGFREESGRPIERAIRENRQENNNRNSGNNNRNNNSNNINRGNSNDRVRIEPVDPRSGTPRPGNLGSITVPGSQDNNRNKNKDNSGVRIEDSGNNKNNQRDRSRPGQDRNTDVPNPVDSPATGSNLGSTLNPSGNNNNKNNGNNKDSNRPDNARNRNRGKDIIQTPAVGATPTDDNNNKPGGRPNGRPDAPDASNDLTKKEIRQERRQTNEEARREAKSIKLDQRRGTPVDLGGRPTRNDDNNAPGTPGGLGDLSKKDLRRLTKEGKRSEDEANKAASQLGNILKNNNDKPLNRKDLNRAERAVLIGANARPGRGDRDGRPDRYLSSNNTVINNYINNIKIKNVYNNNRNTYINIFNNNVYNDFRNNIIPDRYRPWGGYGRIHQPIMYPVGGYNNFLLPPPAPIGTGPLGINLSWNYWDGHGYYDHGYARNLFVSLGHRPYNGYDGIVVQGRYWSYGWGWMDGCIDYGDRRMWVPGFWAPYTVEECGQIPVWIPPVYEDVWTGCCWERIQVDGGYFAPPIVDCRMVTRYSWVPGHYQYYY